MRRVVVGVPRRTAREVAIGDELWLHVWYRVICGLEASYECDAVLDLWPCPLADASGRVFHGQLTRRPDGTVVVACAREQYPLESVGTMLHEVAHFAQNPRHTRHHGYSFRRCFVELVSELLAVDIRPRAREFQRMYRRISRSECIDLACVQALSERWPLSVRLCGDAMSGHFEAVALGRRPFAIPVRDVHASIERSLVLSMDRLAERRL